MTSVLGRPQDVTRKRTLEEDKSKGSVVKPFWNESSKTWSHYTFREMLKTKAELYEGVNVVTCDEAYTSKTCGQCGWIHAKLGGSKTYRCQQCHYHADRDVNAARNIMLRYLSLKVK